MVKLVTDSRSLVRNLAKESLVTYSELVKPSYRASKFHRFLARNLEDCFHGRTRRLCVSVPPRHGKSELSSILFPSWVHTKRPDAEIMQAGYAATISTTFSIKTKGVVASPRYLHYFPPVLHPSGGKADDWYTTSGGSYLATSIDGGAVGRGADFFICDDLFKNRAEAGNKAHRDKVWEWFVSTASTRLSPTGVMIMVMTRWDDDDVIGRLTDPKRVREFEEAGLGDYNFKVIRLEAICENPATDPLGRQMGEPLWPERWGVRELAATKLGVTDFEWNAQYQQRPNPPGGNVVNANRIIEIERSAVPAGIELVRGWDLAVSAKNLADYSAGALVGLDREGNFYLVHMDRGKRSWDDQRATIYRYLEREAIGGRVGIEAVGAWETAVSDIRRDFAGRVIVKSYTPKTDKLTRALPWMAKVDGKRFFMVRGEWNQAFLDELKAFPNGHNDDQIDAVTVGADMLLRRSNQVA